MAEESIPFNRLGAGAASALGDARVVRVVGSARVVGSTRVVGSARGGSAGAAGTARVSVGAARAKELAEAASIEHFVR